MSPPIGGADVSAIVPTYNGARWLPDALDGLASQTVRPGEIVIADDCSTDDTPRVVEAFRERHPELRVVLVSSAVNTGNAATRNRGITAASGRWVANCDDDDVWLPTKLGRQLDVLAGWRSPRPVVGVTAWGINVNERLDHVSPAHMGPVGEAAYDEAVAQGGVFFCLHSSLLLERDAVLGVGGYRSEYDGAEDVDLLSRLATRGVITCVDEELVLYRKRLGSIQSTLRDQDAVLDRAVLNARRRRDGLPEVTTAEIEARLASEPWRRRGARRLRANGKRHYRRGSVLVVNGHRVQGAAHLAVAALLDWNRVSAGVRSALGRRR